MRERACAGASGVPSRIRSQGHITEALRQFEAFGAGQFQVMAASCCCQAKARRAVPQKTEGVVRHQIHQLVQGVETPQRQRQAQHPILEGTLIPGALRSLQQVAEGHRSAAVVGCGRHPGSRSSRGLLKCMGLEAG